MSIKYSFPISDTLNNKVDSDSLVSEIRASSVAVALDYVGTANNELEVWMKGVLSIEEEATLFIVVSNHKGVSVSSETIKTQLFGLQDLSGRPFYRKSFLYEPVTMTDNRWGEKFSSKLSIQGGEYVIIGTPTIGDYLEMMVVDVDNVLGYGSGLVVQKFFEQEFVCEKGFLSNFITPDAAPIPTFLYLMFRYVSVGELVPKVIVRYNFRRTP